MRNIPVTVAAEASPQCVHSAEARRYRTHPFSIQPSQRRNRTIVSAESLTAQ